MVTGRTTEPITVASVTKTTGSAAVTAAAGTFGPDFVGRTATGTGLAAGTTVLSVQSGTAATLSANATATNTTGVTFGPAPASSAGFLGWSPESATEAGSYSVASANAGVQTPDRITSNTSPLPSHRARS
jgi:hypothetical protein